MEMDPPQMYSFSHGPHAIPGLAALEIIEFHEND